MIPPIELGKKDFSRTVRGYSTQEVDDHLRFLMEKYTALYHECEALEEKVKELESENNLLKTGEDAVRESLLNAQKASGEILEKARERADIIVRSTKRICDNILADFVEKREKEKKALIEMKRKTDEFHDKAIDGFERAAANLDRLVVSVDGLDEMIAEDDDDIDILLDKVKEEIREENEEYERRLAEVAAEEDRKEREKAEKEAAEAAEAEARARAEIEARAKAEVDEAFRKQEEEKAANEAAVSVNDDDEFVDLLTMAEEEKELEDAADEPKEDLSTLADESAEGTKVFDPVNPDTQE